MDVQINDDLFPGFPSQRPACGDLEVLIETRPEFANALGRVISHIRMAADGAEYGGTEPFTFVVQAPWGAGKSTSLEYIRNRLCEPEDGREAHRRVKCITFDAALWDDNADPRVALAAEIAQGMLREDELANLAASLLDGEIMDGLAGYGADIRSRTRLVRAVTQHASLAPMLEGWLASRLGSDGRPLVCLVLIDDLDRCTPKFTARLLHATSYWINAGEARIFFGLASAWNHLVQAMKQHMPQGVADAEEALQKYVHLRLDVPEYFQDAVEVAAFIRNVFRQVRQGAEPLTRPGHSPAFADLANRLESLEKDKKKIEGNYRKHLSNMGRFQVFNSAEGRVLAPAVQAGAATPRDVKDRFIHLIKEYPAQARVSEQTVKEAVVRAYWPDFWWRCVYPLTSEDGSADRASLHAEIQDFVQVGSQLRNFWELQDSYLDRLFDEMTQGRVFSLRGTRDARLARLAIYLSAGPSFPWPLRDERTSPYRTVSQTPPAEFTEKRMFSEELPHPDAADSTTAALSLYLESEQAMKSSQPDSRARAINALNQLSRLAESGLLGENSSVTVSNAAVNAENLDEYPLAERLYEQALGLNRTGWGHVQNYVDFILNARQEHLYPRAEELIEELDTAGRAYRPERTQTLKERLAAVRNTLQDPAALTLGILDKIQENPSLDTLAPQIRLLMEIEALDGLVEACRIVAENATDDRSRYVALRLLADGLAPSSDRTYESLAAEIYRYLLVSGLVMDPEGGGQADADAIRHNLATLLNSLGHRAAAIAMWRALLGERRADDSTRRSLAMALSRSGSDQDQADALAVLQGQEIDSPMPVVGDLPLPLYSGERWWEALTITARDPVGETWLDRPSPPQ